MYANRSIRMSPAIYRANPGKSTSPCPYFVRNCCRPSPHLLDQWLYYNKKIILQTGGPVNTLYIRESVGIHEICRRNVNGYFRFLLQTLIVDQLCCHGIAQRSVHHQEDDFFLRLQFDVHD